MSPQAFELKFGDPESIARARQKGQARPKIEAMYARYGSGPDGQTCKDCAHLIALAHARNYYKCKVFGVTSGPATDWRVKWLACGAFEAAG